ncbi:MAG TPA: TCR/Tet family MFS transporter [Pirellulales bacterium]|nr:TCR/Tet family MFS transporter [Pirellulales bacterium]
MTDSSAAKPSESTAPTGATAAEAADQSQAQPGARRAALVFIFVTVVLDVLALGIIIPVLPELVKQFLGGDTRRAAEIFGVFGLMWGMMQFIFSPVMGTLSDRFGRRPVLLISTFGLGLDYVLMALAPTLSWLFVGRVISGITSASFTTAAAYIADVTPAHKRAGGFGMLSAAWGLGFVLGPALGGTLGEIDLRLPFWVAAGCTLLSAAYGLFVLPESLPREKRAAFSFRRANPIGALALLRSHPELLGLAAVLQIYFLAHEVLPSTFVLYTDYRYGWSQQAVGLTLATAGVCSMFVQGLLVQPFVRRFGERRGMIAGLVFGTIGMAIFGLATVGPVFLCGLPFISLWGLFGPSAQSLMTQRVGPSEQGKLQGALNGLRGMADMAGPVVFTTTFAAFIETGRGFELPGASFLLGALLLLCAAALAWRVTRAK